MKSITMAFVTLLLLSEPSAAGPDATTSYLIDDTASMMDIGMLRLNTFLVEGSFGIATFDWESNRFTIRANALTMSDDPAIAEKACGDWVNRIRNVALVNPDDGKPSYGQTQFSIFFEHVGFDRKNAPKTLSQDLDRLFVLECVTYPKDARLTVSAPLLGKTYSVQNEPWP